VVLAAAAAAAAVVGAEVGALVCGLAGATVLAAVVGGAAVAGAGGTVVGAGALGAGAPHAVRSQADPVTRLPTTNRRRLKITVPRWRLGDELLTIPSLRISH
jgi:hypothetical protein